MLNHINRGMFCLLAPDLLRSPFSAAHMRLPILPSADVWFVTRVFAGTFLNLPALSAPCRSPENYSEEGEPRNSRCDTTVLPQLCPGVKFARFGHSEDAPQARGDLRTSMEPPRNPAPGPLSCLLIFGINSPPPPPPCLRTSPTERHGGAADELLSRSDSHIP